MQPESECHSPGESPPSRSLPWSGDPRAGAKTRLFDYALNHPGGVVVNLAARTVLDSEIGRTDDDLQLARRFYLEDYAHLFETFVRDDLRWVKAESWAFLKSSRQASPETPERGPTPDPDFRRATGSLPSRAPSGRAARVAQSVLRDRCSITPSPRGDAVRGALTHALAAHRQGVDSSGMRPDRVSSPSRVARRQGEFLSAFETAGRLHREGALLSLTARPGESGDTIDTNVAVNDSVGPLRKWLSRRTPGDGAPDMIVVREFTERGVLHLHIVVFGVSPGAFDREALASYWHETRGHGYVVDIAPVERQPSRTASGPHSRWVFADHALAGTEKGTFVRDYLGEGLHRLRRVSESSPDDLHRGDVEGAWKVAIRWATGLPVFSTSPGLRGRRPSPGPGSGVRGVRPASPGEGLGDPRGDVVCLRPRVRVREYVRGLDPPVRGSDRPPPLPRLLNRGRTHFPNVRRRRRPGSRVSGGVRAGRRPPDTVERYVAGGGGVNLATWSHIGGLVVPYRGISLLIV
jgi:hypothetical protein